MADSESYLASLGIDVSDVDRAVDQTVTILGHLGNQFDSVAGRAEKAATSLTGVGKGAKDATTGLTGVDRANAKLSNSAGNLNKNIDKNAASLPRLRYALYDVSFAAGIAGAALVASGVAVEGTAIKYEAAFANVKRTSDQLGKAGSTAYFDSLRAQLVGLTGELPKTFTEITDIATAANQLGVSGGSIASFTKTVAEFSAVTNASIDSTSTSFGRLGQILKTNDYRALGDDIAYLGVRSVATETQIAATAQQIAVSTQAAKFGVGPTLALATALASLGIKPEQARGSILRTFSQINAAVQGGGKQLADLAAISGTTSSKFASDWQNDASSAFTAFLTGVGRDQGKLNTNLASIGITAARDRQTIGLLSQNTDVLASATSDLADANGFLDKSYDQIAQTTQAKLTIAGNNVLAIFDEIGKQTNGPFADGLNFVNGLLTKLAAILSDPLAAGGVAISVVFATLVGVAALAFAAFLRLASSAAAIRTAAGEASGGLNIMSAAMLALRGSSTAATASNFELAASNEAVAASSGGVVAGNEAIAASSTGAAAAGGKLSSILGKAGLVGSLLALVPLFPAIADGINQSGREFAGISVDVDTLTQKIKGLNGEASKLSAKDIKQSLFDVDNKVTYGKNGSLLPNATITGAQAVYNRRTTGNTTKGDQVGFRQNGNQINEVANGAEAEITAYDKALAKLQSDGNQEAVTAGLKAFHDAMKGSGLTVAQQDSLLTTFSAAQKAAGDSVQGTTSDIDDQATVLNDLIAVGYGASNAAFQLQTDMTALGSAFVTNGANVAGSGAEIQKVIGDIYAASNGSADAANNLQAFFDKLVQGGYASSQQLAGLSAIIYSLGGATGAGTVSTKGLATGFNTATAAAKKAAAAIGHGGGGGGGGGSVTAAVRTLVDYAGDLQGVFSRAFQIRFGRQDALDDVKNGWATIKKNTADAQAALAGYKADLEKLTADKSVNEYFLSVAQAYGDTLRGGELSAAIAQNNVDIAAAQSNVRDAQEKTNKTLKGNSQAARDNRAAIEDQVNKYQAYIQALAASGISQEELEKKTKAAKAQFIAQGVAAGYSKGELDKYSASFTDMAVAIDKVPRKITVSANVNPALQALNEFAAKATKKGGSAGSSYGSAFGKAAQSGMNKYINPLLQDVFNFRQTKDSTKANPKFQLYNTQTGHSIGNPLFKSGGYTGTGDPNKIAGSVHYNEFVLNATGAKMIPRPVLEAANQGRVQSYSGGGGGQAGNRSSSTTPALDARTLREMRRGNVTVLNVDGKQLASTTTDATGQNSHRRNR